MENSPLELPREWKDKIEADAQFKASLQFHIKYSPDQHTACMITYRQGAMGYAPWLYTCQINYAALKERAEKMEAALEWIKAYGPDQSKEGKAFIDKALAGKEVDCSVVGKCIKCGRHYPHKKSNDTCNKCESQLNNRH